MANPENKCGDLKGACPMKINVIMTLGGKGRWSESHGIIFWKHYFENTDRTGVVIWECWHQGYKIH